jgi:hypothetical protein
VDGAALVKSRIALAGGARLGLVRTQSGSLLAVMLTKAGGVEPE